MQEYIFERWRHQARRVRHWSHLKDTEVKKWTNPEYWLLNVKWHFQSCELWVSLPSVVETLLGPLDTSWPRRRNLSEYCGMSLAPGKWSSWPGFIFLPRISIWFIWPEALVQSSLPWTLVFCLMAWVFAAKTPGQLRFLASWLFLVRIWSCNEAQPLLSWHFLVSASFHLHLFH
jgi:hypothetical protein